MNPTKPAPASRITVAGIAVAALAAAYMVPASAGTVTIDIPSCATPSASANGATVTINCTNSPPPVNAPVCSPTAAPSSLPSNGGEVTLTGNCTTNTTASTTFAWSRAGVAVGAATVNTTDTAPANAGATPVSYTYGLRACNGTDCTTPSTNAVTVAAASGGGGPISCAGFANTVVVDLPLSPGFSRVITNQFAAFGTTTALVIRMTPAGATPALSTLVMMEYGTSAINRFWTISNQACDFDPANKTYGVNKFTGPQLSANLGVSTGGTFYVNVRNWDPRSGQVTCNTADCAMFIELYGN